MYIYTVQAMPGQKAKFEGDTAIKYRVKRQNTSVSAKQKGHTQIIRTNLEYEEAIALINGFNSMEAKSQDKKNVEARRNDT